MTTPAPPSSPKPPPFATPAANMPAGAPQQHAPADDLDFSAEVAPMSLGPAPFVVKNVRMQEAKLLLDFKVTNGPARGTEVTKWCDPANRGDLVQLKHIVEALGVEMVTSQGGDVKPACGWLGLKGKVGVVILDEWDGKYTIPKFGKIQGKACPAQFKTMKFGCGVFPEGTTF